MEHNESPFAISQWQRDNPYLSTELEDLDLYDNELPNDGFPLETDSIKNAYSIKNIIKEFCK